MCIRDSHYARGPRQPRCTRASARSRAALRSTPEAEALGARPRGSWSFGLLWEEAGKPPRNPGD
eukprot:10250018-Alexandrium_andersonii.AAC.1